MSLTALLCLNLSAQTTKSTLAIYGGPSFPVGDFADTEIRNEESGLANVGRLLSIDYGYRFSKHFGIALNFRNKNYSISDAAFASYYMTGISNGTWQIDAGSWKLNSFLTGFFYTTALTKTGKLNLEMRALGGIQVNTSPSLDMVYTVPGSGSFSLNQPKYKTNSFAYLAGLNLKYQLGKTIGLKLSADYTSSQPKFMVMFVDANGSNMGFGESKQNITAIDLGAGLYLTF